MTDQELKNKMTEFMQCFELVFDGDWDFSKGCLTDDSQHHYIVADGTFLVPKVADEDNNWANRGALLAAYRELLAAMKAQGIHRDYRDI